MTVITISRQYGSRGNEIARLLCDRLGYRYFDKELAAQLGAQMGLAPDQVVDLPEDKHQVQSLLERLFSAVPNPFGDPGGWGPSGQARRPAGNVSTDIPGPDSCCLRAG